MKKLIFGLLLCPLSLLSQPLRVAVAANAQFVMEQLKTSFQKNTGIAVEAIVKLIWKAHHPNSAGRPL